MPPAKEREGMQMPIIATFKLCGLLKRECHEDITQHDEKSLHEILLQDLEIPNADTILDFHIEGAEQCRIRRPIDDIFRLSSQVLQDRAILIHAFLPKAADTPPAADAEDDSRISVRCTLVGHPNHIYYVEYDADHSENALRMHHELTSYFCIDGDKYVMLFHVHEEEPCQIQRPHTDLYICARHKIHDKTLCLHPYNNQSDALDPATGKLRAASKDPRKNSQTQSKKQNADVTGSITSQDDSEVPGAPPKSTKTRKTSKAESSKDAVVKFNISFSSRSQSLTLDPTIWKDEIQQFSLDEDLADALFSLKTPTVNRLRDDVQREKSKLKGLNHHIEMYPALRTVKEQSRCGNVDDYGKCHVLTFRDLLGDITEDMRVPIKVFLTAQEETFRSKDPEEIVIRDWYNDSDYYRVGTVMVPDETSDSIVSLKQLHTVLAWYHDDDDKAISGLRFSAVATWKVNGCLLGDNDLGKSSKTIPKGTVIEPIYGAPTKDAIHKLLSSFDEDDANHVALQGSIPDLPTHCFNDNDKDMKNIGVTEWPKNISTLTVSGPFIEYNGERRAPKPTIPPFFNITVKKAHEFDDICKLLDGELQRRWKGKKGAAHRFKDGNKNFSYELWALPQKQGVRKMFRYKKGKLTQFMPRDATKAKKEMYMEAHIVPMETEE